MGHFHWGRDLIFTEGARAGTLSRMLMCTCINGKFRIYRERTLRQARTMNARHVAVVAECLKCGQKTTVGFNPRSFPKRKKK